MIFETKSLASRALQGIREKDVPLRPLEKPEAEEGSAVKIDLIFLEET